MTPGVSVTSELERVARVARYLNDQASREALKRYHTDLEAASSERLLSTWQMSRLMDDEEG